MSRTSVKLPKLEDFDMYNFNRSSVDMAELVPGCPRPDCIPSIDSPSWLDPPAMYGPGEEVIAIIAEKVYAVPVSVLNYHEIVNFDAGRRRLALTYCPLCQTIAGYDRALGDQDLEFGVSGLLWNSSLVLYDRGTNSLFSQVTGECIVGEFLGHRLTSLPVVQSKLGCLQEKYSDLLVLSRNTGSNREKYYDRPAYSDYRTSDKIHFPVAFSDDLMHPKALVYSLELDNNTFIVAEENLHDHLPEGLEVEDICGHYLFSKGGVLVPSHYSFYFTARAFYPDAAVLK